MEATHFVFTTPFNVNVIEVKGKEKVFMEGLISTTDKDLVNDIVTKACLESMQKQILERNIKLDIEHEAFRGNSVEEKELNKTLIPAGKIIDATVREKDLGFGLVVKSELNNFRQDFERIKGNVIERFLDAYSIAFIPTKISHKSINGEDVRLLDDVRLLNVALTGNPVNTHAQNIEVFMKSIDAVEEYKNEKEENPELENKLEVKTRGEGQGVGKPKQGDGGAESCKCPKCGTVYKKEKDEPCNNKVCPKCKVKLEGKNHTHASDTKTNKRRLKKMSEEEAKPEETETTETEAEAPVETETEGDAEQKSELKALKELVEKQAKEIAEIKTLLKKPIHKAIAEPQKKDMPFHEVNPLDAIA